MRFSPNNRFKFTRRHIEIKDFYDNINAEDIKTKFYEFNRHNVAVLDYVLSKDLNYQFLLIFRIIRPRYQIAYKDKYGKIYYSENVYETFKQARLALEAMTFNSELSDDHNYYVEIISYLDEEI